MKKIVVSVLLLLLLALFACSANTSNPAERSGKDLTLTKTFTVMQGSTSDPRTDPNWSLIATGVPPITLIPSPTLTGQLATIVAAFDMGGGGAGFAATIYAQEIYTGKTFHSFMPAGMHGLAVLPTSPPISFAVQAPGTYVFYARLINAPDDYHYGATRCKAAMDCQDSILLAIDVQPGGVYQVYIADRNAILPAIDLPVTVPWTR